VLHSLHVFFASYQLRSSTLRGYVLENGAFGESTLDELNGGEFELGVFILTLTDCGKPSWLCKFTHEGVPSL
jgi:hypothetical protein